MNACLIMCGRCLDFFVAEWTLAPSLGVCECSARTLCSSWNGSAADSCWCPSQFGGLLHNRTDQEHQQCYSWSSGPDHPFSSRWKEGSPAEGNVVASCTFASLKLQNERSNECLVPSMIFKLINNWCKVIFILYLTAWKQVEISNLEKWWWVPSTAMLASIIPAIGDRCKVINWWPALALTCSVAAARLWCMSIGVVELDGYPCWRTTLVSACHLPYCSNWRWDYCSWCPFIRDYCTGK